MKTLALRIFQITTQALGISFLLMSMAYDPATTDEGADDDIGSDEVVAQAFTEDQIAETQIPTSFPIEYSIEFRPRSPRHHLSRTMMRSL